MNFKRFVSLLLITLFFIGQHSVCLAENFADLEAKKLENKVNKNTKKLHNIIRGRIERTENGPLLNEDLFTGEYSQIEEGAKLRMTVSSVISSGLNQEGDEFFAEITDDFSSDSGIVIPKGTVAHGSVSKVKTGKRLGREGHISLDFDYLITPDGRKIPIEAHMTTKRNAAASTAKVVLEDTAYTVAGGVIGGLMALKFFGLGLAVSTKGATVAGGAGVGAVLGLTGAIARKGAESLIVPGDEIKVKIVEDLNLPVFTDEALKEKELHCEGLDARIVGYALTKDPFGEANTINLGVEIINKTQKTFSTFDMALVSEYKRVYYASPFGNTDLWFLKIQPGSRARGMLSFSVDNPKKKHWLVFYDSRSRKPVAKISVNNAVRDMKKFNRLNDKKKKKKQKR